MSVGPMEVAVVLILFVLIFGARRLPEAGRSLGSGLREFKQGLVQAKEPFEIAKESMEPGPGAQGANVERN